MRLLKTIRSRQSTEHFATATRSRTRSAPIRWIQKFVIVKCAGRCTGLLCSELNKYERSLPCKVSCSLCGTFIADEGRNMWLAFPSLFDFGVPPSVPKNFKPTCHVFYSMRVININDDLPKWSGHKNKSMQL